MSDPRGAYFQWRTGAAKRQSWPDIDYAVEQVLRECWSAAFDRGRKEGVMISADLRSAADAYRAFADLLERWDQELFLDGVAVGDPADGEEEVARHRSRT